MLIAGTGISIFIFLLLLGMPVAFAFVGCVVFLIYGFGLDPQFLLPYSLSRMQSLVILAIPFFIIAGNLMEKGNIVEPLVDFINSIASRLRGGLATVGIITNAVFGAISGSAAAAIVCIGPVMIPRLEKEGYPRGYATALMTSAAGLSLLIPPSIDMIFYGWLTRTSVTACFLAGVFPGILMTLLFCSFNWVMVGKLPTVNKPRPLGSFREVGREVASTGWRALPALMLPVIILGSIYGGIATATEAAAVAAFLAVPLGFFVYRGLTLRRFATAIIDSGITVGVIMVMIFASLMVGRILAMENIPTQITNGIMSVTENKYTILLMANMVMILMGMLMDDITGMILSIILLLPMIKEIGISSIHFAAIVTTNLTLGLFSPPFAPLLFLGIRVGKTNFPAIFRTSMMIIFFVYLPVLMLVTFWPPLSEWLPVAVLGEKVMIPIK